MTIRHKPFKCIALYRIVTLALVVCFMLCQAQTLTSNDNLSTLSPNDCVDSNSEVICRVVKRVATYQLQDEQSFQVEENYECLQQGDASYDLSLPQSFLDSHPELDQGLTSISVSGACIKDMAVMYPPNATITVLPTDEEHRRLAKKKTSGNVTLLVVRATETGYPELRSNNKIRAMIFGNVAGSLTRQMSDCSFGKFNIHKAQGPGINDGLLEVDLDIDLNNMWNRDVERIHLVPLLARYGGESAFDHVAYCIPYGTSPGRDGGNKRWLAYALVNHGRSVYNHFWCGLLTASQHELGHNLGLHHSGQGEWKYGDATASMGWSSYEEFGPRLCFNAQKNTELGWYSDRAIDLTDHIRTSSWEGRLVAFVDYNVTAPGDVVLIRVGNLHLQYNRAEGFNEGTREYTNRVVIVSDPPEGSTVSNLEAALAHNIAVSTFTYPTFNGTGHDIVFKVCDQVRGPPLDYVQLSIHLDNGVQSTMCSRRRLTPKGTRVKNSV